MIMKVFWSWQSDTPWKTGRQFIREILKEIVQQLQQELDEPDRDGEGLHLDHDIEGTTGLVSIVDTIFQKINASTVIVADITCVGEVTAADVRSNRKKRLINSNVALELGYAIRAIPEGSIIAVLNEAYGSHDDMPFDLRHKGGVITFNLSPEADEATIKREAGELTGKLASILRKVLKGAREAAQPAFQEKQSTYSTAVYFDKKQILASNLVGSEKDDYIYEDCCALCYMRVVPTKALSNLYANSELEKRAYSVPILGFGFGNQLVFRNGFGAIKWCPGSSPLTGVASISASTQLFRNGEIWSICQCPFKNENDPLASPLRFKYPAIRYKDFEAAYRNEVPMALSYAIENLKLDSPLQLILGVAGVKGAFLPSARQSLSHQSGPIELDEIECRSVITNNQDIQGAIVKFFKAVWDAAGESRPPQLYGFPSETTK